jgi:hypothetical protein
LLVVPVHVPSTACADSTPSAVVASNTGSDWRATDRSPVLDVRIIRPNLACSEIRIESGVPFTGLSLSARSLEERKAHANARFGDILMARHRLATRPLPICHNTALRRLVFSHAWPFGNIAAREGAAKFPELAFELGPDSAGAQPKVD